MQVKKRAPLRYLILSSSWLKARALPRRCETQPHTQTNCCGISWRVSRSLSFTHEWIMMKPIRIWMASAHCVSWKWNVNNDDDKEWHKVCVGSIESEWHSWSELAPKLVITCSLKDLNVALISTGNLWWRGIGSRWTFLAFFLFMQWQLPWSIFCLFVVNQVRIHSLFETHDNQAWFNIIYWSIVKIHCSILRRTRERISIHTWIWCEAIGAQVSSHHSRKELHRPSTGVNHG